MIWYLAGAIDYEEDKGSTWREELKKRVQQSYPEIGSVVFFDPVTPYMFNKTDEAAATYIHDMNMQAIDRADGIIARIMKGQTVVGTPIELYYTILKRKPIILLTDMEESVYIRYIRAHSIIADDLSHIVDLITQFNKERAEFEEKLRESHGNLPHGIKEIKKLAGQLGRPSGLAGFSSQVDPLNKNNILCGSGNS